MNPRHTIIAPRELQAALRRGDRIQLIDVRSPREFEEGHVPGAVNIPLEQIESRLPDVSEADTAVLICRSGRRAQTCEALLRPHRERLALLEGGTVAWESEGLPLVRSRNVRLPLMRQVQIGAGSLVLLSVALALTVHPGAIGLAAFVGAGLLFAGMTGFCGMAVLLDKMPWNARTQATACEGGTR